MNVSTLNRKFLLSFLLISILTASIGSILNKSNDKTMGVKAMEVGEFIDCEGIEVINKENAHDNLTDNDYGGFEDSEILLGSGGTGSTATLISGTNDYADPFPTATITDLTNVKYIQNSNYFLMNPRHHVNDGSDNSAGTCTTVAMQMLMGYHNYYSDRRIIPNSGNGRIFLNEDYGNLDFHPAFLRSSAEGQGCLKIGTEDGVYSDVFDRTWFSGVPGIGQAIGLVKDGAVRFINAYTPQAARNGLSLTSGFFSASQAKADIDAGRPIVLGMSQLFKGNFHVVPAFGYAKLDGVEGFLVHYGWGDGATQVWVPSSWFGFKIRMSTTHVHTYSAGGNRGGTHKDLTCSVCGGTSVDELFSISGGTLSGVRYGLSGSIAIPSPINIYNPLTASFINQSITTIGAAAFTNQTQITAITIPSTVTTIGEGAFYNTGNANINFIGRTSVPSSFNLLWNKSVS